MICRDLRTFWRSLAKKVPFWVKRSVLWARSALLLGIYSIFYWVKFATKGCQVLLPCLTLDEGPNGGKANHLVTFQRFFFPPPSESKISKIQLSFSSGVLIIIANFAWIHFTSFRAPFPSYHQHCDNVIVKITVMFSWKSMLPLLSSSNIPYTESHKMPPCVTTIIAIIFSTLSTFFLLSNASPPSRQRTASSRWLLLDISPWTWGDRFASLD